MGERKRVLDGRGREERRKNEKYEDIDISEAIMTVEMALRMRRRGEV